MNEYQKELVSEWAAFCSGCLLHAESDLHIVCSRATSIMQSAETSGGGGIIKGFLEEGASVLCLEAEVRQGGLSGRNKCRKLCVCRFWCEMSQTPPLRRDHTGVLNRQMPSYLAWGFGWSMFLHPALAADGPLASAKDAYLPTCPPRSAPFFLISWRWTPPGSPVNTAQTIPL